MIKNGLDNEGFDLKATEGKRQIVSENGLVEIEEFDYMLTSLPSSPDKETISKLLIELPARLLYLKSKGLEFKKAIADAKTYLNLKKKFLEARKSEVRKSLLDDYNKQLEKYRQKSEMIMGQVMSSAENPTLKKTYLQEMLKIYVPNKPSKADLDDEANILTSELQDEINELENKINAYSIELEILGVKEEFYENMWLSIRLHKGILVEEMRMGNS